MQSNLLLNALFLALISAHTGLAQMRSTQKYPINRPSPEKVGQKYTLSATGSRLFHSESKQGEHVLATTKDYVVTFEGRAEVLAVDEYGAAFQMAYTVDKFTKTENGVTGVVIKPGSIIYSDGSQPKERQVFLKNGVMGSDAREVFELIFPPHRPLSGDDHDAFLPKDPKAIGETWPIDKNRMSDDFKDSMIIPEERLTGTVTLVSKGTIGGSECLNLAANVKADGVVLTNGPEDFSPEVGTMQTTVRTCTPTKASVASARIAVEMNTQFRVTGKKSSRNEGITLEVKISQKTDLLALEVKP